MAIAQRIKEQSLAEELQTSFTEYAMAVIKDRALPDARDGLKPVIRRILFAMFELKLWPEKPHKKCVRIVGDVNGKYHPHGDTAVYEALVRLAQWFSMRYTLVDGQGNFGTQDPDPAAAMRYTEAKLTPFSVMMLEDLGEHIVPFDSNFDNSEIEPSVLPSKMPNLLMNGTSGIAVGMATNMIPHNGVEVLNALIAYLRHQMNKGNAGEFDVTDYIKGPDFPTGGTYINPEKWRQIAMTGSGTITVQATCHKEKSKDRTLLIFTDIPYGVNKKQIFDKMVALTEKIKGIYDIRDESGKEGTRIVVEVQKDVDPNYVLHMMYAKTPLQSNTSVQNRALVVKNGELVPDILSLVRLLQIFIEHRTEVVSKKLSYDLQQEEKNHHILEGQRLAIDRVDEVIELIRASKNREEAQQGLMKLLSISDVQADAILALRLHRLTNLEIKDLAKQVKDSLKRIKQLKYDLAHTDEYLIRQWEEMIPDFLEYERDENGNIIKDKAGQPIVLERRTKIEQEQALTFTEPSDVEDVVVVVTADSIFRQSTRAGAKEGLNLPTTTDKTLLAVGTSGMVYPYKVKDLPDVTGSKNKPQTLSEPLVDLVFSEEERVYAVFTKDGKGRLAKLEATRKPSPLAKEADYILPCDWQVGTRVPEWVLITKLGMALRISNEELPMQGKSAGGVRVIKLDEDDELIGVVPLKAGEKKQPVTVETTAGTKAKDVQKLEPQKRGGKGINLFAFKKKEFGVQVVTETTDEPKTE
jgi:DNA gyrase subunit A